MYFVTLRIYLTSFTVEDKRNRTNKNFFTIFFYNVKFLSFLVVFNILET